MKLKKLMTEALRHLQKPGIFKQLHWRGRCSQSYKSQYELIKAVRLKVGILFKLVSQTKRDVNLTCFNSLLCEMKKNNRKMVLD